MKINRLVSGFFGEEDIEIYNATTPKDQNAIAIHLLEPSEGEIEDAIETARRDLFPKIVIHSKKTWPK